MGIQSSGIGSNLDVNGIIAKLMQVESQPLNSLTRKEASYQAKVAAYATLNGAVSGFQTSLSALSNTSSFQNLNANVSDSSVLTASTTSTASASSYNINVTQIAKAQSIATLGQASTASSIGSGASSTINIQFGTISGGTLASGVYTGATFTQDSEQALAQINIDSSNNSLSGIRDAINAANKGVTASIVGDGTATPYRLVLTSNKTGITSSMKISVTGDASLQALLNYDPASTQNLTQTNAAQNALVNINGIDITSKSNTVTEAIQGTSLQLNKAGTTTVNISANTSSIQSSITSFVKSFNDLQGTFKTLIGYDASAKKGGILIGDATARNIQNQIRNTLNTAVNGLGNGLTSLSSIGITFQKDGTLSIDSSKLQNALSTSFSDVAGLFSTIGKASDSLTKYIGSSSATKQGTYALSVSALATQGNLTGDLDLNAASTTIAANTTIKVVVDSTTANVNLTAGTYTANQLATLIQTSINGNSGISSAGLRVSASITSGGFLKIESGTFGSRSNISLADVTGTSFAAMTGSVSSGTAGNNVAGTINGVGAVGDGQILTGANGSDMEGLKLMVTGGSLGSRGNVYFSQGYASQLSKLIGGITGSNGSISNSTDALNKNIRDIGKQRDILNSRLIDTEARYRAQFTALDRIVSNLNSTSSFLSQQLSSLNSGK